MLQCPILCSFLFNFEKEVFDRNGVLINNYVFVVENELPHSCPVIRLQL